MLRAGVSAPTQGARALLTLTLDTIHQAAQSGVLGRPAQLTERVLAHPKAPLVDPGAFPLQVWEVQSYLASRGCRSAVVGAGVRDFLLLGDARAPVDVLTDASGEALREAQAIAAPTRVRGFKPDSDFVGEYLAHSDFIVCALAVNLLDGSIVDSYGAVEDARLRRMATVESPTTKLARQPPTSVRALRIASTHGLTLSVTLDAAIDAQVGRFSRGEAYPHSRRRFRTEVFRAVRLDPESCMTFLCALGAERVAPEGSGTLLGVALGCVYAALRSWPVSLPAIGQDEVAVPKSYDARLRAWADSVASLSHERRVVRTTAIILPVATACEDPLTQEERSLLRSVLADSRCLSSSQVDLALRVLSLAAAPMRAQATYDGVLDAVDQHGEDAVSIWAEVMDSRDRALRQQTGEVFTGLSRSTVVAEALARGRMSLSASSPTPSTVVQASGLSVATEKEEKVVRELVLGVDPEDDTEPPRDRPDPDEIGIDPTFVEDALIPGDDAHREPGQGAEHPDSPSLAPAGSATLVAADLAASHDTPTKLVSELLAEEAAAQLCVTERELCTALRAELDPHGHVIRSLREWVANGTMTNDRETLIEAARDLAVHHGDVPPMVLRTVGEEALELLVEDELVRYKVRRDVYWKVRTGEVVDADAPVEAAVLVAAMELLS